MKVLDDPICRGCKNSDESATHILCNCENFAALRFEHLGYHLLEPWELQDIPIRSLLNFASATGLFYFGERDLFPGDSTIDPWSQCLALHESPS